MDQPFFMSFSYSRDIRAFAPALIFTCYYVFSYGMGDSGIRGLYNPCAIINR